MLRTGLLLFLVICYAFSFNVDDKYPVTFPSETQSEISGDSNYFGYAVVFRSTADSKTLLVSAPRHDQQGAVFMCSFEDLQCRNVDVSNNTVEQERSMLKDGAWIGSAIDVQESGKGAVVCGSLLSSNLSHSNRWSSGGCYWKPDADATRADLLVPFTDGDHLGHTASQGSQHAYYANGQAGVSVQFSKGGRELIIGAPGFDNSVGSILRYPIDEQGNLGAGIIGEIQSCQAPDILGNEYAGYAVASGRFLCGSSIVYAVGAPRAALYKGQVWLAVPGEDGEAAGARYERLATGSGVAMGDGFGAALSAADVDGDGCDDLLVGAPRARRGDAGAVYVYFGGPQGPNLQAAAVTLVGDAAPRAQFGSAVAAVGDVDGDGVQDVAVGAPYGPSGGAVFLYLGSADARRQGRLLGPQRLRSAGVAALTRPGFGVSIAGGVDVDGNGYADLAVGSFLEGRAVVFRSRPTVLLEASVSGPDMLRLAERSTNVTACLSYSSRRFQGDVEALMVFSGDGSANNITVTISKGETHCENVTWTIKARDKLEPVQIKMRGEIVEKNDGAFCGACPVADPHRSAAGSLLIPFNTGCRNEARCESDLRLHVDASWDPAVTGFATPPVELVVTLENAPGLDTAHVPSFQLEASVDPEEMAADGLRLVDSAGADCEPAASLDGATLALVCRPRVVRMRPGSRETARLLLELRGQAAGAATLRWNATAVFRGHELQPADNAREGRLLLEAPAELALTTGTVPRYISADVDSTRKYHFTQMFRVINAGAFRQLRYNFSICLPLGLDYSGRHYKGIDYVELKATPQNKVECFALSTSQASDDSSKKMPSWISNIKTMAFGGELRASADCEALDQERRHRVDCVAGPLEAAGERVDVSVSAVLQHAQLGEVLSQADIDVIGRAYLLLPDDVSLSPHLTYETNATTTVLSPNVLRSSMPSWVWPVLSAIALLLYAIIVAVLYKMGFFKRKKPEPGRLLGQDENSPEAEILVEDDY